MHIELEFAKKMDSISFSGLEKEILETASNLFVGTAYTYHDWALESEFFQAVHKLMDMDILYEENIEVEGGLNVQAYKIKKVKIHKTIF